MMIDLNSYDFPPFRPPNETNSALLRITRGCPWNRCEFCAMYKHLKFEAKPIQEVKEDVEKARLIYGVADTIFLGDSDSLVHKDLPEIVAFIRKVFPETQRITTYARAKTILHRKTDYLKAIRKAGLDRLHLGLESGDAIILELLNKGAKPEDIPTVYMTDPSDVDILLNLDVAAKLGRPTEAVKKKASRMGLRKTKKYMKTLGRA